MPTRPAQEADGAALPGVVLGEAGAGTRKTGIDAIGDAPWGTHFCQFYATTDDLRNVLVPYIQAGLEADELCMWVTSPPLGVDEAWDALARAVPDLDSYRRRGRIEILPHTDWFLRGGKFEQERVLEGWIAKLDDALARGCAGLRLTGNTFWLEKSDWKSFAEYEAAVDAVLGRHRMLALCTYAIDRCGASEMADVIRNHQFAIIKRDERWELFESFDRRRYQDALARDAAVARQAEREREITIEALRESETRFRLLFQNMRDGLAYCRMLYDARGTPEDFLYVEVNAAFERVTGLRDVVGKRVTEVIPGIREAHPELFETYARVTRTGKPERFEIHFQPLGMWLSISVYSPEPNHFVAVFDDITGRKQAEEEVRRANAQLTEAARRKDEFLGMLSHELRNPLAPIRNSVYLLEHSTSGEQVSRAKAVIRRQAEHLTRLVDDLLDVTRISRGKIELKRSRVDLGVLVRRAGEDHAALMRERGIELSVEVPREPTWVDGDPTRLAQIIGNLLSNSAKFTARGGRVMLSLERVREAAEIHVRDTGAGMEPDLLTQAFDPFVQGQRTLARTDGGLGLGLALVKGITEMHGGSVRAASAGPGQGAEIVARLPVVDPGATARAAVTRPGRTETSRRVLVIDDNGDAAESLAQLVEMFGHVAEVANDGPTGLERARANPPDVVFCDIGLPGMSGYEVVRAFRESEVLRHAQVFAVSGHVQPEDRRRAADAGFDGHIAKPSDPEEIARLLS